MKKQKEKFEESERLVKEFADILESIESSDNKKKMLWKQIYTNAVNDREYASICYTQTNMLSGANLAETTQISTMLVKYLERMSKSNDQLIKLAELISDDSKEGQGTLSSDEMFDAIGEKNGK